MARRKSKQGEFEFRTWGGARRGAGRKPKGKRAGVSHLKRPRHNSRYPVHVTCRVKKGIPNLRARYIWQAVRRAIATGKDKFGFRVIHFDVEGNHIHLIVEAKDEVALGRGMKGLSGRIAKRVNRAATPRGQERRKGAVFVDRYHAVPLTNPRQVRNGLCYVLNNAKRHGARLYGPGVYARSSVNPCSSAAHFDGWKKSCRRFIPAPEDDPHGGPTVVRPRTWLLREGWRRHGLIDTAEVPGPAVPG